MVDISVITLNYKEAQLTLSCVRSVLKSKNVSFEIIVIDNSTDTSQAAILQKIKDKRVKVFISEEAFPHIPETIIGNPLKHIRNIIYLHWRPKDLISLICWRFFLYLNFYNRLLPESKGKIDWSKFSMVRLKMWAPYFGEELLNVAGSTEKTFPYVLRHTQMRPRQLMHLCNEIARRSKQRGTFPKFLPETIVETINDNVLELSTEVINAYSSTYPNTARILTALVGLPKKFKGRELDRIAPRTASEWPAGEYSPLKFRELVAELGIVGRIRGSSDRTGIVEADFEYNRKDRLNLQVDDDCVIHPMFYEKLNTEFAHPIHVYPFPDHKDFIEIY